MKIPQFFTHKKLRAATARRASAASAGMDFGDIPEPNMKLSRALLIVLLLHVVAVSGIIAFNAIKTRENSFASAPPANAENNVATPADRQFTRRLPSHGLRFRQKKLRLVTIRGLHIRLRRTNT